MWGWWYWLIVDECGSLWLCLDNYGLLTNFEVYVDIGIYDEVVGFELKLFNSNGYLI